MRFICSKCLISTVPTPKNSAYSAYVMYNQNMRWTFLLCLWFLMFCPFCSYVGGSQSGRGVSVGWATPESAHPDCYIRVLDMSGCYLCNTIVPLAEAALLVSTHLHSSLMHTYTTDWHPYPISYQSSIGIYTYKELGIEPEWYIISQYWSITDILVSACCLICTNCFLKLYYYIKFNIWVHIFLLLFYVLYYL